jgi:hypothetical protein
VNTTLLRLLVPPLRVLVALVVVAFAGLVGLLALFLPRSWSGYAGRNNRPSRKKGDHVARAAAEVMSSPQWRTV